MIHLPAVNLTYGELVIQNNNQQLLSNTSRLIQAPKDYDVSEAIILFDLTADHTIRLSNITVRDNTLERGTALVFQEVFTKNTTNVHTQLNIEIYNQSSFSNNTGFHAPTSSVYIKGKTPWLWIRFEDTTFENNIGRSTNEYYAKQIKRLEVFNSIWSEKRGPRKLAAIKVKPKRKTKDGAEILEEANKPHSWNLLAESKFLLVDEHQYEVNVTNTKFNCNVKFDQDIIFTQNQYKR